MSIKDIRRPYHGVVVAGVVVGVGGSVLGFLRALTTEGDTMHGMPMSDMPGMYLAGAGLVMVLVGTVLRGRPPAAPATAPAAPKPRAHRLTAVVATTALTIDISKTSTLGFVIPGMRSEYGINPTTASMLAVAGLTGTATGALVFGRISDRIGRRSSYLITTLGFTATSLCGSMPTFTGNVVMCFLMGIAVGGIAPILIAVLTDIFPARTRGSIVTGLSVVATAVGYLVASGSALWLEPLYGWRVLWLIGAPTGLLLMLGTVLIPESRSKASRPPVETGTDETRTRAPAGNPTFTARLQWLYAATVGVVTFGLTTWVPTLARETGLSLTTANALLTVVAVVMVPCSVLLAWTYRRVGPVRLAVSMAFCTAVVLLALSASGVTSTYSWLAAAVLAAALFAINSMAAIFLPIAADLADTRDRGRATGTVSFFNRVGGLTGPLALSFLVSSGNDVLLTVAVLALLCGVVAWYTGHRRRTAHRADSDERTTTSV